MRSRNSEDYEELYKLDKNAILGFLSSNDRENASFGDLGTYDVGRATDIQQARSQAPETSQEDLEEREEEEEEQGMEIDNLDMEIEEEPVVFSQSTEYSAEDTETETETETEEEEEKYIKPSIALESNLRKQPKFIVFLSKLLLLFNVCPVSSKVLQIFNNMGLSCFSLRAYFRHQREKLFPTIYIYWKSYQSKMIQKLKETGEALVIAGDGRHDSMGHSAKYCAYTIFCCTIPLILHFSIVQRNVAGNSPAMEYLAFQNCLTYLLGCGVPLGTLITDRHSSIIKHMRERLNNIKHYFDLWHIKKNTAVYDKMCAALTNPSLVKGIKQASPQAQTSCLEGFHSVLNQYSPKMIGYSYPGMLCRHIIASVHFNHNLHRDIRGNEDGTEQVRIVYPKFKNGEATVRNVRVEPNFEYVEDIYQTFILAQQENTLPAASQELTDMTPLPMDTMLNKQSKQEAIEKRNKRRNMVIQDVPPTTVPEAHLRMVLYAIKEQCLVFVIFVVCEVCFDLNTV
ncbi:hypothetical protein QZH41_014572 [Actinostola sp. cb2023]|nr:hypothetical protein QZH41_014572 [Actinostola sp. cb2023]